MATALHSEATLFLQVGDLTLADFYDERAPTFDPRLAAPFTLERRLPESFRGLPPVQQATVEIGNTLALTNQYAPVYGAGNYGAGIYGGAAPIIMQLLAAGDPVGKQALLTHYDLDAAAPVASFRGKITAVGNLASPSVSFTVEVGDSDLWETLVPQWRVLNKYPNADLRDAHDADPPVIVVFGVMRKARLVPLDATHTLFRLIRKPPVGSTLTVNTIYRGPVGQGAVVPSSEYTVVNAGAFVTIRFTSAQERNGATIRIWADLTSDEFVDNSANVTSFILSNVCMLGQTVNAASFTAAAANYVTLGMTITGGIDARMAARDLLQWSLLHGAYIERNSSGQFVETVDVQSLHTSATISLGEADQEFESYLNCTVEQDTLSPITARFASLTISALADPGFNDQAKYLVSAKRGMGNESGIIEEIKNPLIADATTARLECAYRVLSAFHGKRTVRAKALSSAKALQLNELVTLTAPRKGHLARTMLVESLTAKGIEFDVGLRGYDAAIYTDTGAITRTSSAATILTDYSFTFPDAPTGFAVVSSVASIAGDQTKVWITTLEADAPAANVTHLFFEAFREGSLVPIRQIQRKVTLGQLNVRVDIQFAMGTGTAHTYDLQVFARNVGNAPDFQDGEVAQILSYAPGTDTTDPSAPILTEVKGFTQRIALIDWTPPVDADVNEHGIYRQTLTNLVTNPGFELLDFNGWITAGTLGAGESITQSTVEHSGNYGVRINAMGESSSLNVTQGITVTNGATYTVGGWIGVAGYVTGTARIAVNTGDGTILPILTYTASSGGYQFGYATFVATGVTATIQCQVFGANRELVADFDDFVFVAGTPNPTAQIAQVKTDRFSDADTFVPASCYWYAITAFDRFENESVKSNLVALVPVRIPNEDLPNAAPLVLTGLAVTSSGTYQASDGTTLAWISLSWTNPTDTKRAFIEIAYRRAGNVTSYLIADQVTGTTARVDDLTPGRLYDFRVRGCSHTGFFGPADTLDDEIAPGDTTAPDQVTGLTATDQPPRAIKLRWTDLKGSTPDFDRYEIQAALNAGFSSGLTSRFKDASETVIPDLTPGTTYWFRVRALDFTGNAGAFSASASRIAPRTTTNDLGDDTITSLKLQNLSVENAKIDNLAVTTLKVGDLQITSSKRQNLNTVGPTAINVSANSEFTFVIGSAAADNAYQWGMIGMSWTNNWNNTGGSGTRIGLVTRPSSASGHEVRFWNGHNTTWATNYMISYW